MPSPHDIEELRRRIASGWRAEYALFFAPDPERPGVLGNECLSQWYPSEMRLDGVRFPTAERYMTRITPWRRRISLVSKLRPRLSEVVPKLG
jgi:predicted NAD-dependent protein-ADP-ribosyltransferase YbiA (DUF1768 family)